MNATEIDTINSQQHKNSPPAFKLLIFMALFMVTGICFLLFLGREKARILGQTITELDIQPLWNTIEPITPDRMAGKVVVLHFWGYWCGDCVKEYPEFIKVHQKFSKDSSVLFASVSCPKSDENKELLTFYTKKFATINGGDELPFYCDPAEYSRAQISKLMTSGGFAYPTTLVLDGEGRVVDIWRSAITGDTLEKAIEKAKGTLGKS